jgi:two-component system, chemotaxis family, protein-glutamate methylesterase/glutaminase
VATVSVAGASARGPLRVLVVAADVSRARQLERMMAVPGFEVSGFAADAATAESLVAERRPAAVLVDLGLVDGGLEAIERIMATRPTPIVVCGQAALHPESALAAGAVDVVGPLDVPAGTPEFAVALRRHLTIASRVPVINHPRARLRAKGVETFTSARGRPGDNGEGDLEDTNAGTNGVNGINGVNGTATGHGGNHRPVRAVVVAIGASTGGPAALATILRELPAELGAAVLVVQHMAEGFVDGMARWLDESCDLRVRVAREGDRLVAGTVYLAPAGVNLVLRHGLRVALIPPAARQFHVPAVDTTLVSVSRVCGRRAVGVLLTGMGRDGAHGLRMMLEAGGKTIGQDEATCVVYGMPAAAQALRAVDIELPLGDIAAAIVAAVDERAAEEVVVGGTS